MQKIANPSALRNSQVVVNNTAREGAVQKKNALPVQTDRFFDLEKRVQEANLVLAKFEIRNKAQAELPENSRLIKELRRQFKLDDGIVEMHYHKQRDPNTGDVVMKPGTEEPFKIAEFCTSKNHKASDADLQSMHEPIDQKKTPTGMNYEELPKRRRGLLESWFGIAA